jgi:hypothetical protein
MDHIVAPDGFPRCKRLIADVEMVPECFTSLRIEYLNLYTIDLVPAVALHYLILLLFLVLRKLLRAGHHHSAYNNNTTPPKPSNQPANPVGWVSDALSIRLLLHV